MTDTIRLLDITLRNFMAYGDRPTTIKLDRPGLTVVRGDSGFGKSSIFDAISFVLTGRPIRNKPIGKMVNNINKKKMEVTINLTKGSDFVRISRGQKPGFVRFWKKHVDDPRPIESPDFSLNKNGDVTASDIEQYLGFDNDLFACMGIASNRRAPFLECESSKQKAITESLFRFTELVRRSEVLKKNRLAMEGELTRLNTISGEIQNQRKNLEQRIEGLKSTSVAWERQKQTEIAKAEAEVTEISDVDFDDLETRARSFVKLQDARTEAKSAVDAARNRHSISLGALKSAMELMDRTSKMSETLSSITDEQLSDGLELIEGIASLKATLAEDDEALRQAKSAAQSWIAELDRLRKHRSQHGSTECPTCKREWDNADDMRKALAEIDEKIAAAEHEVSSCKVEVDKAKAVFDSTKSQIAEFESIQRWTKPEQIDAVRHDRDQILVNIKASEERVKQAKAAEEADSKHLTLVEATLSHINGQIDLLMPFRFYAERDPIGAVANLRLRIDTLMSGLERAMGSQNPYTNSIVELEASMPSLPEGTEEEISRLTTEITSSIVMEKLLTRKDSPIRASILGRFLPELNDKITGYLSRLSLPYSVAFSGDLEVEIMDGQDEVSALSGGEEERLAMALNWAFRDIYEEINDVKLGFAGVDERLDVGLPPKMAAVAMDILRETAMAGRSVWVITHKPELEDDADQVMFIEKSNRFSSVAA